MRRNRKRRQVHARGTRGERDVRPPVHDDSSAAAARRGEHATNQGDQARIVQIPLAKLDEIHSRPRDSGGPFDEPLARLVIAFAEQPPVGDGADEGRD